MPTEVTICLGIRQTIGHLVETMQPAPRSGRTTAVLFIPLQRAELEGIRLSVARAAAI